LHRDLDQLPFPGEIDRFVDPDLLLGTGFRTEVNPAVVAKQVGIGEMEGLLEHNAQVFHLRVMDRIGCNHTLAFPVVQGLDQAIVTVLFPDHKWIGIEPVRRIWDLQAVCWIELIPAGL